MSNLSVLIETFYYLKESKYFIRSVTLPLFFAFDQMNYRQWVPLYYEDCQK